MVSTAASMLTVTSLKEPVAADCKNTEYIAQLGLLNVKFMKNEDKICFLIHTVRLCHLSLHELHPFFHFYHNSHTSYLTVLASLPCQLIFLSLRTPVSPISNFLISTNTIFLIFE